MATSRITQTSDVSYTLPEGVDDLILTGTDNIDGTGNTLDNQITGNVGNNVLQGLEGSDTLLGGDGSDILDGGLGADYLLGGAGDDTYIVDQTTDQVIELPIADLQVVRVNTTASQLQARAGDSSNPLLFANDQKIIFQSRN